MTYFHVAFVCLLLLNGGQGIRRIGGPQDVDIEQFPYIVSLRLQFTNWHFCCGVIISPKWVLTAAHCLEDELYRDYMFVHAGSNSVEDEEDDDGEEYEVNTTFTHPTYHKTIQQLRDDLGLVQLKTPFNFSSSIQPIKLGRVGDGKLVVASGWGQMDEYGSTPSKLQKAVFKTLEVGRCKAIHAKAINHNLVDGDTQICIYGGLGNAVCSGDSGGPLVRVDNKKLVGIFSGLEDCTGYYPPLYVRLSAYVDWIRNVTGLALPLH